MPFRERLRIRTVLTSDLEMKCSYVVLFLAFTLCSSIRGLPSTLLHSTQSFEISSANIARANENLTYNLMNSKPTFLSSQDDTAQDNALFAWISVSPSDLEHSGEYVDVEYSLGLHSPKNGFWIGVYLVGEDVTKVYPVKYKPISSLSIQGKTSLQLHNMRASYAINLMTGPPESARVVARSKRVAFRSPSEPTQRHVSLTDRPSELRVSWTTVAFDSPARRDGEEQLVQYGAASGSYPHYAVPSLATTYGREELCGGDAAGLGYRCVAARLVRVRARRDGAPDARARGEVQPLRAFTRGRMRAHARA